MAPASRSIILSGLDSTQVKALVDQFIAENKQRSALSNRREFLAPFSASPDSRTSSRTAGVRSSTNNHRDRERPTFVSSGDDDENADDVPSTCARTDVQRIDRSTQMRRQVVHNPDSPLARSLIPAALRKSRWELDNVPLAYQERVYNIWTFLNMRIESFSSKTIALADRIEICHRRLREIEEGYQNWLLRHWSDLHPSHFTDVLDLTYPPAHDFRALFYLSFNGRGETHNLPQVDVVGPPDQDGEPAFQFTKGTLYERTASEPRAVWVAHVAKVLGMLEDRILRIERDAPLWFALNFEFPDRPKELPPVPMVRVYKQGPKWSHETVGAPK
ncbi:hypothetical protein GGF32_009246 [Allomyces javanicus]|nr:hypothetical protein GGF32_009246 [Allomyces javanicus]